MKNYSLNLILYFIIIKVTLSISSISEKNKSIREKIEDAGCPYYEDKQLLMENVCLMPHYQPNEPSDRIDVKINVDLDYYEVPSVLEIDEKKNKITVDIMQHLEWKDPRIRANFSAMPNMMYATSHSKLTPAQIDKIWHPNHDMFTFNLQDWKYLYDPHWFQSVGILRCPTMRNCDLNHNLTTLYANKHWIVTLFCKFDFSKFPMDTQYCKYRQIFGSTSEFVDLFLYSQSAYNYTNGMLKENFNWNYEGGGFDISITPVGTVVQSNASLQNASRDFGFNIKFKRIFQPYLYQTYLPCIAIVGVSLISFIIPLSAIPGRVALMATIFLTLTNIFIQQMADSPSGSRLNSLASYLLVSLFFVLATMIEFAIVMIVKQNTSDGRKEPSMLPLCTNSEGSVEAMLLYAFKQVENGHICLNKRKHTSYVKTIDLVALFSFAITYIAYNCFYFISLMQSPEE